MYKSIRVLLCCLLSLAAVACNTTSTPDGVVGLAGEAIQKNDLAALQGYLIGNAEKKFGDDVGMLKLRQRFLQFSKLSTDEAKELGSGVVTNQASDTTWASFEVGVAGDSKSVATAKTYCETSAYEGETCHRECTGVGINKSCDNFCVPATKHSTTCWISDLNLN